MIDTPNSYATCGCECSNWTAWRSYSHENRKIWKGVCSVLLVLYAGWYTSLVLDSWSMIFIGTVWTAKLLAECWGQDTPNWVAPGSWPMFIIVYGLGLPSFAGLFGYCRNVDMDIPYREQVALLLYLSGSAFSLGYELHRFNWKAQPENKGRLHTVGLAKYTMHPNYFGDLFTYAGWGLAAGTQCALSIVPAQLFWLIVFIIPNSDAYLANKYSNEFPAYEARTARLIPFVRSRAVEYVLAWSCLVLSIYMELNCGAACRIGS